MAHHMACKGLPGLRAVASLAGTSYVEDSSCDGAPPVSVLQIHGTADEVIRFDGDATEPDEKSGGEQAFYASATDMVTRWSQRAGCELARKPRTLRHPRPRPIRSGLRNPNIPRGIGLPRRNQHRALGRRRQQPFTGLRRNFHRRIARVASVTGLITPTDSPQTD